MIIFGHRGARAEAPENTVEGFVHANATGCRHFELDIQLSKDKQLMVFHDKSLKRSTGHNAKLASLTADELESLDARVDTPGWPTPCSIPRLTQVIESCPDVTQWQFEVKSDSRRKLIEIANQLEGFIGRYSLFEKAIVTSSNRWFLKYLRNNLPSLTTGIVSENRLRNPVKDALSLNCEYLVPYRKLVSRKLLENAHENGLHVSVWTVNQDREILHLRELGVDSVITDRPSEIIRLMENQV